MIPACFYNWEAITRELNNPMGCIEPNKVNQNSKCTQAIKHIFAADSTLSSEGLRKRMDLLHSPGSLLKRQIDAGTIVTKSLSHTIYTYSIKEGLTLNDFGIKE